MADTTLPGLFDSGDHASRPAANAVGSGALYSCTTHALVYQSDGSSWTTWATLGGDISAHTGDTSDAHDASAISVLDTAANFTGTDVEAVLAELQDNIDAVSGGSGEFTESSSATRTAGDLTTTSTSWVDATSLSVTITTAAVRCLVIFIGNAKNSSSANNTAFDLDIDGASIGGSYGLSLAGNVAGAQAGFTYLTDVLTAASHTFKIRWRVDAGTGTLFASSSVTPARITVLETSMAS